MNTTLTLQIDDHLLQKAHHLAVDEHKTVSAWVAELIQRTLEEADEYEQSRQGDAGLTTSTRKPSN